MKMAPILSFDPGGGYVAFDFGTGTTTQGDTADEATANLREALELHREEFPIPQ